jgi:hypothetical protein
MWTLGLSRAIPFLEIFVSNFGTVSLQCGLEDGGGANARAAKSHGFLCVFLFYLKYYVDQLIDVVRS